MKKFKLIRSEYLPNGTRGVLTDNVEVFQTIERPWLNNQNSVSCIPTGTYIVKRFNTEKRGDFFMFMDVPDRTEILIHVGNSMSDLKGCIALGRKVGELNGKPAVFESGLAMSWFMYCLNGVDEFECTIEDKEKATEVASS